MKPSTSVISERSHGVASVLRLYVAKNASGIGPTRVRQPNAPLRQSRPIRLESKRRRTSCQRISSKTRDTEG